MVDHVCTQVEWKLQMLLFKLRTVKKQPHTHYVPSCVQCSHLCHHIDDNHRSAGHFQQYRQTKRKTQSGKMLLCNSQG